MNTMSTAEFCEAAGVTYRQVDWWTRNGVLVPVVEATGSGSRRRYNPADVVLARFIVAITAHRHSGGPGRGTDSVEATVRAVNQLAAMADVGGIVFVDDTGRLSRSLPPGEEACVAVNLDVIAAALTVEDSPGDVPRRATVPA